MMICRRCCHVQHSAPLTLCQVGGQLRRYSCREREDAPSVCEEGVGAQVGDDAEYADRPGAQPAELHVEASVSTVLLATTVGENEEKRAHSSRLNHFAKSLCGKTLTMNAPRAFSVKVEVKRVEKARKQETMESSEALVPDAAASMELTSVRSEKEGQLPEWKHEKRTYWSDPRRAESTTRAREGMRRRY